MRWDGEALLCVAVPDKRVELSQQNALLLCSRLLVGLILLVGEEVDEQRNGKVDSVPFRVFHVHYPVQQQTQVALLVREFPQTAVIVC